MWAAQLMRLVKPLLCHIILIVAPDLCILFPVALVRGRRRFPFGEVCLGFIKKLLKGEKNKVQSVANICQIELRLSESFCLGKLEGECFGILWCLKRIEKQFKGKLGQGD